MHPVISQALTGVLRLIFGRFVPVLPQKPDKLRLFVYYTCAAEAISVRWEEQNVALWTMKDTRLQHLWMKLLRHPRTLTMRAGRKQFTHLKPKSTYSCTFSLDVRTGVVDCQISEPGAGFTYPYLEPVCVCTAAQGGSGGGANVADVLVVWDSRVVPGAPIHEGIP